MSRSEQAPLIVCTALAVVAVSTAVVTGARYAAAKDDADAAANRYLRVQQSVEEVERLRSDRHALPIADGALPDAISAVVDALADAGLPSGRLRAHRQESDRPLDAQRGKATSDRGARARVRVIRVDLEPLALHELGRFLASWHAAHDGRSAEPVWAITRIDIEHRGSEAADPPAFAVRLTIAAPYLGDPT